MSEMPREMTDIQYNFFRGHSNMSVVLSVERTETGTHTLIELCCDKLVNFYSNYMMIVLARDIELNVIQNYQYFLEVYYYIDNNYIKSTLFEH